MSATSSETEERGRMTNKIFNAAVAAALLSVLFTFSAVAAVFYFITRDGGYSAGGFIMRIACALVPAAVLSVLAAFACAYTASKAIIKPIEKMGDDLKNIDRECPFDELRPFAEKVRIQLDEKDRLEHLTKQFTANFSHELKTPLTAISGYGELLQSSMTDEKDTQKIGAVIYKESQRLINLSHDIIQLSQLEEYDFTPILDTVDLASVAESCAAALSVEANKMGVTITTGLERAFARGTKSLLEELVYNLVENAVRYNVENGSVFIGVKEDGNFSVLTVKDTGIGIEPKYQSRIFERFFRVDKSRSKETGGTGLGLAIVKHTAEYLGGTVELKSETGRGTEITVRLPRG